MNLLKFTHSCCICWKSCNTFSNCPSFICFVSLGFHAKMFNYIIFGAIVAIYVATHGKFHQSSSQSASYVFLCLTFEYLFFMIKNPNQDDKLSIFHIPCINRIIKIKKVKITFSINILHLSTFSKLLLLDPTIGKDLKRISTKLRPMQDNNKEKTTRLTPRRAMAPLTCEF